MPEIEPWAAIETRDRLNRETVARLKIESLRFKGRGPYDFAVEPGECVCLSGPSGAGKTLLLRSIADLDPHEGRAFLDEVDSSTLDAPVWRRTVGLLPAESQWWSDTVRPHFSTVDPERLEALGFGGEVMDWEVSRLSTGERQRLALLRLLVNRPRALLLDEPTAALDASNVDQVEALLEDYRNETKAPVLWVSHDPAQAARVSERRFEISEGQLTPMP
jgi:ABC-type iron transport system FetAB ATPase subunit